MVCSRFPTTFRPLALNRCNSSATVLCCGSSVAYSSVNTAFLAALAILTTSATDALGFVSLIVVCTNDTMTYDAAKSALMQALPDGLAAGATKGTLGITSFIKRELVADNGKAPQVKPPRKGFMSKQTAQRGLQRGRKFDAEFQEAVAGGRVSAMVQQAVMLLRANNVVALKCQQRVVTDVNKLTTQIDVVGICTKMPYHPVAVELKTCQLPRSAYQGYAMAVCQRTPMLRCVPPLDNCERVRHLLQAGYSALALQQLLNVAYVQSYVLIMCADGPVLVPVPKVYYNLQLYMRLKTAAAPPPQRDAPKRRAATEYAMPTAARRALMLSGLQGSKTCVLKHTCLVGKAKKMHGIALYMPTWLRLQASQQQKIAVRLQASARKCGKFTQGATPALYVIAHLSRQSKQLTVQPVIAPFAAT